MTETATGNIPGWRRTILLFLTSQCITLFGSTLVQMALVWYAAMETASGAWVAAFTVCSYLPQFLVSFPGGVWADRFHRKMLIIGADAAIALATLGMVLAIPHISSEPALLGGLLIMSVVRSLGAGVQTPAVNTGGTRPAACPWSPMPVTSPTPRTTAASTPPCSPWSISRLRRRPARSSPSAPCAPRS